MACIKTTLYQKDWFLSFPSATVLRDSKVRSGQFSLLYKMALITGNQV